MYKEGQNIMHNDYIYSGTTPTLHIPVLQDTQQWYDLVPRVRLKLVDYDYTTKLFALHP